MKIIIDSDSLTQENIIKLLAQKGCLLGGKEDKISLKFPFTFENPIRFYLGIGQNSKIGAYTFSYSVLKNTTIGRYCGIARDVIVMGDHPTNWLTTNSITYGGGGTETFTIPGNEPYKIYETFEIRKHSTIGNDVWIGTGVKICGGINIGTGAIIGAGAVVTKDVPPYAIVAGVPAKLIRYRFDEKTIKALLQSQWWDYNLTQIRLNVKEPLIAIQELKEAQAKNLIQKYTPEWIEVSKKTE